MRTFKLPRLHLFEFEDLRWLPKLFRNFITDLLTYQLKHFEIYHITVDKIQNVIHKTGHDTIVDLCSGSGGPIGEMRKKISKMVGREIQLIYTDKFPNISAFKSLKDPHIHPTLESVDARRVSSELKGMRTLFTAFHHFRPSEAKEILQDAVRSKMPIGIFEITERKWGSFLTLLVAPLTCLIFSLYIRPFKLSRLFWTYVIPVIPILYTWDGLISNLRTYNQEEWRKMIHQLKGEDFFWETGELPSKFHIKVSYLIGYPKNSNLEKKSVFD